MMLYVVLYNIIYTASNIILSQEGSNNSLGLGPPFKSWIRHWLELRLQVRVQVKYSWQKIKLFISAQHCIKQTN